MHYIVNNHDSYPGVPDLDPETGRLKIPGGGVLEEDTGWQSITIKPGEPMDARQRLTEQSQQRAADRRRNNPRT